MKLYELAQILRDLVSLSVYTMVDKIKYMFTFYVIHTYIRIYVHTYVYTYTHAHTQIFLLRKRGEISDIRAM